MLGSHIAAGNIIRFRYHHDHASKVSVAGNFSGWQPVELGPLSDGWWGLDIGPMPPGNIYYKFTTPEGWAHDQFNYRRTLDGQNSFLCVAGTCGHLLRRSMYSPSLGAQKEYVVYLPATYSADPQTSFPYLILMGGLFEGSTGWVDRANIHEKLDTLIGSGQARPMIVVMPDKDDAVFHPEAWDAYFGFLSGDLPGHIETDYRTSGQRGAEGLSLGGVWALRLGTLLPERFCSVASLSGEIPETLYTLVSNHFGRVQSAGVRYRLSCGNGEGTLVDNNRRFHQFLLSQGFEAEFHVNPGIHRWPLWESQIANSLLFHSWSFGTRA